MKKLITKAIAVVGVMGLSVGVFSGCSSGEVTKTSGEGKEVSNNKGTGKIEEITVMLFDRGNPVPEGNGSLTDNRWTKWVNEEMEKQGVRVKYVTIPRSEETAKVPVLMASGSAPDVTYHYSNQNVRKFYDDGGIYKLNDYIDQYGENIKNNIGDEAMSTGRTPEGDQYAVMSRRSERQKFNAYIRKDWLDKLGLPIPTTVDELYTALKAFKEQDPGNVGKENIIAYWPGYLTQFAFIQQVDEKEYFVNGINHWRYFDPGYKEALRWQNKLYNEGLMHPEYFVSTAKQMQKEALVNGTLGYIEGNFGYDVLPNYGSLAQNLEKNVPGAELVAVPPMKNVNDGEIYNPIYPASGIAAFVPKTSKSPEAAVKYMNFLAGEGGMTLMYGVEGEHYNLVDGIPVTIDPEYNTGKGWLCGDLAPIFTLPGDNTSHATAKSLGEYEANYLKDIEMSQMGKQLADNTYRGEVELKLGKSHGDYQVQLITCAPEEFDAIYAGYENDMKEAGLEELRAERSAYYDGMNK